MEFTVLIPLFAARRPSETTALGSRRAGERWRRKNQASRRSIRARLETTVLPRRKHGRERSPKVEPRAPAGGFRVLMNSLGQPTNLLSQAISDNPRCRIGGIPNAVSNVRGMAACVRHLPARYALFKPAPLKAGTRCATLRRISYGAPAFDRGRPPERWRPILHP